MTSVNLNGNTYSDDTDPNTGLAGGGHRKRWVPCLVDAMAEIASAKAAQVVATDKAAAASSGATGAATSQAAAAASATAAASSQTQAQSAAAQAQAVVMGVSTGRPISRPTLLLAPAASKTLDPRATFARSTAGWRTDEFGLVAAALVPAGVPRFQFDPITLACRGLLIEDARTNMFLRSDELEHSAWSKSGVTVVANAVTGPGGGVTAEKIVEDASNGAHAISQTMAFVSGNTYCVSVFAKAAERSVLVMNLADTYFGNPSHCIFNLATGAFLAYGAVTASMTPCPGGWYLCSWSCTAIATGSTSCTLSVGGSYSSAYTTVTSYQGDGSSGIYMALPQLEQGAACSSRIPTAAATVARTAETFSLPVAGWLRQGAGTIYAEFTREQPIGAAETPRVLTLHDGSASNRIALALQRSGGSDQVGALISAAGVDTYTGAYATYTTGSTVKVVLAWDAGGAVLYANGTQVWSSSAAAAIPSGITTLSLGTDSAGANQLNGVWGRGHYWPGRLANAYLQALAVA